MKLQVEIQDFRRMLKEKCEEIISDKKLAYEFYCRICDIEEDDRFTIVDDLQKDQPEIVRCKDCKYRSFYCTEATDGTTLYTCHHPCANDVPRPFDWFCADGERRDGDA